MIQFSRTMTARPGKLFELVTANKEMLAVVKKVTGIDGALYGVSGGAVGELVSVFSFNNFSHYEENVTALLSSSDYQAAFAKSSALIEPGARDRIMRSI